MTTDQVVNVLENAAARLDARGWATAVLGPINGPNCMEGAIKYAVMEEVGLTGHDCHPPQVITDPPCPACGWSWLFMTFQTTSDCSPLWNAALDAVKIVTGTSAVWHWNDDQKSCTSGAEAADKIREAAKVLASRKRGWHE